MRWPQDLWGLDYKCVQFVEKSSFYKDDTAILSYHYFVETPTTNPMISFGNDTPLFATYLQNTYLQFRTLYENEIEICLFGMFRIGVGIL